MPVQKIITNPALPLSIRSERYVFAGIRQGLQNTLRIFNEEFVHENARTKEMGVGKIT